MRILPPFTPGVLSLLLAALLFPTVAAHAHGTFHERVEALSAALREKPDDPGLLFRLAAEYLEHGDWNTTLGQLAHLDRVAPGVVATDLLRGRALAAGGRFAEAKTALDAYLVAQPGHAVALGTRAEVLSELGQPKQAAADMAASIAATPRPEPDLYFELANFHVAAGQNDEAVKALDDGIAKLGLLSSLLDRAIELEVQMGRTDSALARIDARLPAALPLQRPMYLALRANVLTRAGRTAEAHADWQALREYLAALPPLDRASHSMLRLAEQANQALATPAP